MYVLQARRDPEVWVNLILYLRTRGWKMSRDSSVGIATRYGLDGPGIESRWRARSSASVQTVPGDNPASCTISTRSLAEE